jgi:hypothetical protein
MASKTSKTSKTTVAQKINNFLDRLVADGKYAEKDIKEMIKEAKIKDTKFSEPKKTRGPSPWNNFMKEYKAICDKKGDKYDITACKEAYAKAKVNKKSKWYQEPKEAKKENPYKGLAQGSAVPDMPDHIMGVRKPIKKDGAHAKALLKKLGLKDEEVLKAVEEETDEDTEEDSEEEWSESESEEGSESEDEDEE